MHSHNVNQQDYLGDSQSIDEELLDFELPPSLNGIFSSQNEDEYFIDDSQPRPPVPHLNRRTHFMPPPPPAPIRNQVPPQNQRRPRQKIFNTNYTPVYQDLPDVPPAGPEDFSYFVKFSSLDEARQLAQSTHSSNDGSYLLIPIKFITRIRNDPRLKPLVGYFLKK